MTITETTPFDHARAEAFGERMVGVLNDACLALMTSIGHQTGLFDTMAGLPPSRSTEIAAAAQLHERYVREWLSAMTTGRVVDYDPDNRTYHLPAEHAACLTRAAGPDNLATTMQFVPLLATVEGPVVECFRSGGGVPYQAYTEFHRLMAEDSAGVHDAALIDAILPLVPELPQRLEAGMTWPTSDAAAGTPSTSWPKPSRPAASPATTSQRRRSPPAGGRPRAWAWPTPASSCGTSPRWGCTRDTT